MDPWCRAGAMTPAEELTVLGRHLSTLPVEPTIGKALVYSVLLRCVSEKKCGLSVNCCCPCVPNHARTHTQHGWTAAWIQCSASSRSSAPRTPSCCPSVSA